MKKEKKCGHNVKCGCEDKSLTTQKDPCVVEEPCYSSECAEVICTSCVSNCESDFEYQVGSSVIKFKKGERLDVMMQKILIFSSNVSCLNSAAVGLKVYNVTRDSLVLAFEGFDNNSYTIKAVSSVEGFEQSVDVPQGLYQYKLINLIRDMEYKISVVSNTGCSSPIITVKTKEI